MRDLAKLLEVLYSAHERVAGLQAEFRDWSHPRPSYELVVDREKVGEGRPRWRGAGPWPRETSRTRRMWFASPDRLRVEILRDHRLERLGVRDRSNWWRWDEFDGATASEAVLVGGASLLPPLLDPPLLDPVRLILTLRLEPAGLGVRADREVLLARAWPREPSLTGAVLSYEFEFDAEHGTMLRHAAVEDGWAVQVTEALQVRYGGEIDAERFVFVPPDGRPAQWIEPLRVAMTKPAVADPMTGTAVGNGQIPPPAVNNRPAATVWLTGLPAAGKTTLAYATRDVLVRRGNAVCVLDGDALRRGLSSDLGLSPADRREQARRAAHLATLISSAGVVAIVALVSPYTDDRQQAREIHDELGLPFLEAWVDTPLAVCEQRDPKGLYARARTGELHGLTGVDAPYEAPEAPELRVAGHAEDPEKVAARIAEALAVSPDRIIAAASNR